MKSKKRCIFMSITILSFPYPIFSLYLEYNIFNLWHNPFSTTWNFASLKKKYIEGVLIKYADLKDNMNIVRSSLPINNSSTIVISILRHYVKYNPYWAIGCGYVRNFIDEVFSAGVNIIFLSRRISEKEFKLGKKSLHGEIGIHYSPFPSFSITGLIRPKGIDLSTLPGIMPPEVKMGISYRPFNILAFVVNITQYKDERKYKYGRIDTTYDAPPKISFCIELKYSLNNVNGWIKSGIVDYIIDGECIKRLGWNYHWSFDYNGEREGLNFAFEVGGSTKIRGKETTVTYSFRKFYREHIISIGIIL